MWICGLAKSPTRINVVNVPQVRLTEELEVVCPEVICSSAAGTLEVTRSIPVDSMVMFSKIELGVIASLVSVLELIAGRVKGAGDITVATTAAVSIDFQ